MSFNLQDQMLKAYIDKIFDKYDTDKSGTLDQDQLTFFFNDLFQQLGIGNTVTKQQSLQAIRSIDQNSDGSVDKGQLFDAFKKMITRPQQQPMTTSYPPPQYPNYNQPSTQTYNNPYQSGYNNPYNIQNPYTQPQQQYPITYQNQPPQPPYYQYNPQYNPQYNNANSNNAYNPYMSGGNQYMGGSTGNRWGRMQ